MTLYIPLESCIEVKEEKEYALNEMSSLMSFFSWTYQKEKRKLLFKCNEHQLS